MRVTNSLYSAVKCLQLQGASLPWPLDQGLCPWTPLGAPPPDPHIGSRSRHIFLAFRFFFLQETNPVWETESNGSVKDGDARVDCGGTRKALKPGYIHKDGLDAISVINWRRLWWLMTAWVNSTQRLERITCECLFQPTHRSATSRSTNRTTILCDARSPRSAPAHLTFGPICSDYYEACEGTCRKNLSRAHKVASRSHEVGIFFLHVPSRAP